LKSPWGCAILFLDLLTWVSQVDEDRQ